MTYEVTVRLDVDSNEADSVCKAIAADVVFNALDDAYKNGFDNEVDDVVITPLSVRCGHVIRTRKVS